MVVLGVTGTPTMNYGEILKVHFIIRYKFCFYKSNNIDILMFLISCDLCSNLSHSLLLLDYIFLSLLN